MHFSNRQWAWLLLQQGYSLVAECVLSMHDVLGSIPSISSFLGGAVEFVLGSKSVLDTSSFAKNTHCLPTFLVHFELHWWLR